MVGCSSLQIETSPRRVEPTPTATQQPVMIGHNRNADALVSAKLEVGKQDYGFAPLLLLDETRLIITNTVTGEDVVMLRYPPQPVDPTAWLSVDSFVLAYGVQQKLMGAEAVVNASIGQFEVAASVGDKNEQIDHFAVWVDFTDDSGTVVDLTPLAPDFGAYHQASSILSLTDTERKFTDWRTGVPLNSLQPLLVINFSDKVYYLLGKVLVSSDKYEFSLQAHLAQPASHTEPLSLTRGSRIDLNIDRADFAELQSLIQAEGETAFEQHPEMWQRYGDDGFDFTEVLEQNLNLLWHLVTKMENP